MKNWQEFVKKHHSNAEIINENKIKLPCIGWDKNKRYLDHYITACEGYYLVEEYYHDTNEFLTSWEEQSIKMYLGY